MTARGLRNNNPGNIRRGEAWRGLAPVQSDPSFCQFVAPVYGIRALVKILLTYQGRGLDTVRKIINAWAPAVENDTGAYVAAVAREVGVSADEPIKIDRVTGARLVAAIIRHENGSQPYAANVIQDALSLAGVA